MLKIGDKAPEFTLEGDDGKHYSLKDFAGKTVVLYFYPKDNTTGCTTEAREFSELAGKFAGKNAVIVGISPDGTESHEKFKEEHNINFLLLSDPDKAVAALYGAYGEKNSYGKTVMGIIRSTFMISEDGVIVNLWKKVKPEGHAESVLCELK